MDKREEARHLALETLTTALPPSLFREPIEYVFADHFRQRTLCSVLDQIAEADVPDRALVGAALAFLQNDFGPHVIDEEEDLFPLLRQRAAPEDEINKVLDQLSEEHASDEADAKQIVTLLGKLKELRTEAGFSKKERELLKRFAANERQHLIVENAIVLPLARARLSDADKQELGMRMAARRGIDLSQVMHD